MRAGDPVLRAAWLAQPAYLIGEVLIGLVTGVTYSFRDDTISALGTSCGSDVVSGCSSAPAAMNVVFIVFGVLQALGAVLLLRRSPRSHQLVGTLWAVAGLFSILVGLLPVDDHPTAHTLVALPVFVAQPLAILLHARLMPAGATRRTGLVLGVVAVSGAVALAALLGSATWEGAVERVTIWPAKIWLLLAAVTMLRGERRP
jgi:hypothetical membrane protein